MSKYFFIISIFILSSCQNQSNSLKYLDAFIVNNWSDAFSIEVEFPEAFSPDQSILSPQMTWKTIIKVKKREYAHCLFYRIPHRRLSKGRGIIKVTRISLKEDCSNVLERKAEIELDEISHLKVYFTSKLERNLITKAEFKPFHLYISASKEGEKDWGLALPLHNISSSKMINPRKINKKIKVFKKYDEPWTDSYRPGMSIFLGNFSFKKQPIIDGNISLDYSQNNFKFCYRVDNECKVTKKFECDKCKKGWYSIVDFSCKGGGSKLCGPSGCGGRNQPACPKGESFETAENGNLCFRGSRAGLCQKGLETYCDENNVLVCR